jgi:hypothetical protein
MSEMGRPFDRGVTDDDTIDAAVLDHVCDVEKLQFV